MLNEVLIEGLVSGRVWTYNHNQYFRLAVYRDQHRPLKQKENRDQPDYITVRLNTSLPADLQGGMKVRVHGYIQSREYNETLDEWVQSAKGPKASLSISEDLLRDVSHHRVVNEIVADHIVLLSRPESKDENDQAGDEPKKNGKKPAKADAVSAARL